MADIKHTFTSGKMNKDLDERLVPNGQYRDALNVEIVSSSSGDIGSASTMRGTKELLSRQSQDISSAGFIGTPPSSYRHGSKFVGSISDEKTNRSFFFVTPQVSYNLTGHTIGVNHASIYRTRLWKDMIVCYDDNTNTISPVVIDIYEVHDTVENVLAANIIGGVDITQLTVNPQYAKYLKPGMSVNIYNQYGALAWDTSNANPKIAKINQVTGGNYRLVFDSVTQLASIPNSQLTTIRFTAPRVLNFRHDNYITGISIIDDLLFWTDNNTEPKKININRCMSGSSDFNTNTKLHISDPSGYDAKNLTNISNIDNSNYGNLLEEHITVIKKPPRRAPKLDMSGTLRAGNINGTVNLSGELHDDDGNLKVPGNYFIAQNITNVSAGAYVVGDVIIFSRSDEVSGGDKEVRAEITEYNPGETDVNEHFVLSILSIDTNITSSDDIFTTILEQPKAMFEFKFGRFASRYKYEDGEYSSFSPWSELAFLPGGYDYEPKEGYNLGMVNNLRQLTLHSFIDDDVSRPADVVAVDLLYKEVSSPNCYVVKSITRGRDPEWISSVESNDSVAVEITSEMIHSVLPANQSLRVWDNVPRRALAQEVTGSRLLYGNYTQGYNRPAALSIYQAAISKNFLQEINKVNSVLNSNLGALPSMKSFRKYKVGVVLGDKYGRETPVISTGTRVISNGDKIVGDINIDKNKSASQNRLVVQQHWDDSITPVNPPEWAEYCKYYVKETSGEYYNLSMDRVYDAEDSNIWLSFMSHDRNKVDEDTYLILKKTHKSNAPVDDMARYKILAIENDAPEHIKTEHRTICELTPPTNIPGNTLYSQNSVSWSGSDADAGAVFRGFKKFEGTGYARVLLDNDNALSPKTYKSAWKKVARANDNTQLLNNGDITYTNISTYIKLIDANFGNSARLDQVIQAAGETPDPNTWRIEIKDAVVTNKPEFDGRFFVKIHRDEVLENYVIENDSVDVEYIPEYFFRIGHISTKHTNADTGQSTAAAGFTGSLQTGLADGWTTSAGFSGSLDDDFANCMFNTTGAGNVDNGNQQKTKNFWQSFDDRCPPLFIDHSHAVKYPRRIAETGGLVTTYPSGISDGDNGPNSRMHISWIGSGSTDVGTNLENAFPFLHMSVGKLFRFQRDPDHRVYRVTKNIWVSQHSEGKNFHRHPWISSFSDPDIADPDDSCENCNNETNCKRHTVEIHFECITDTSGLSDLTTKGIQVDRWDPRGDTFFSGERPGGANGGSCDIETMVAFVASHEPVPASIDSAIWETEPKETAELDIYYEASSAIPMYLSDRTINDFAPLNSVVSITKSGVEQTLYGWNLSYGTSEGTLNTALLLENNLPPSGRTHVKILSHKDNTITVGSTNTDGSGVRNLKAGGVGTLMSIDNRDGTITESSIIGHATVNGNGVVIKNKPVTFSTCGFRNVFSAGLYSHSEIVFPTSGYSSESEAIAVIDGKVQDITSTDSTTNQYLNTGTITTSSASDTPTYTISSGILVFKVNNFFGPAENGIPTINGFIPGTHDIQLTEITGTYVLDPDVYKYKVKLPYHNCYVFGNGVESDRIRDDFNAATIGKGFKASTTLVDYSEETRSSGMIYSGIYNSISGVNQLNEFNMAESITKDLNPLYGPIQALKTRDTNVVAFCEDKVLKILANKDALFNADGSTNITSSSNVLGSSVAFAGDYGISSNPESLAADGYRFYFTDRQRGKVLRLSQDGLTPISDAGMTNWFRDNLKDTENILGTFDEMLGEYNVTLTYPKGYNSSTTVSFNEKTKGWTSFRSYIPETGLSINNKYITGVTGKLWKHHDDTALANNFYNSQHVSTIDILFNDEPSVIKSFKSVSYEGSQAKVNQFTTSVVDSVTYNDGIYDNLSSYKGWYVSSFSTDKQEGTVNEFIEKEGKWFNNISGVATTLSNLDTSEFTVQGIGFAVTVSTTGTSDDYTLTIQNDPNQ